MDDLVRSGQLTVQQIFDIATESVSQDSAYEAENPSKVDHVWEYLANRYQELKNDILLFSSQTGKGRDELLDLLSELIEM
ncbi:hypothetical protein [Desulfolucanica intricata]|uniref:hypothetical protein n=1 Tax=Desulfolucanica intricata TaxID=1285191 RepID=UPI00082F27A2|nr:hypothetical protein [Desulfolucanica intricata]